MDERDELHLLYEYGTIVIFPPTDVRRMVSLQRERYDPVSQSHCDAHISVTQPFQRPLDQEEWDRLFALIASHDPFEIRYGPLGTFLPYPCIWYAIQPAEPILELRAALHRTGYFNLDMEYPEDFIPHMTITEGFSGPSVDKALLEQLQAESGEGTFYCDGLSYIVPDSHLRFQADRFLPFSDVRDTR